MDYILEVENLRKDYKDFILKDISFKLPKGYIMGFIGPNGAGKTTTIKLIMNLIKKESGTIKVFDLDNNTNEVEIKQKIGFVYDENYYYEDLNIEQIKKIIAPFYKNWDDGQFKQYLRDFDLPEKKKIKELSRGMKMKFSLAVALAHDADLIIMDEPTSGLDPIVRNEVLEILAGILQDERKGVLFSSHITSDLDKIADYITFIDKGSIIFSKSREEIIDNYAVVKGATELIDRDIKSHFIGLKEYKYGFEALTDNISKVKQLFKEEDVIIEKATLEEIMLYTVKGNKGA